jgi:DNA-binding SARP family transcriptional activator/tetratricopeptide (TPR) repeat protein
MQLHLSGTPRAAPPGGPPQGLAALDAALLAWLALEGPTPRNRLAALLWPEKPPEAARNSLRQRLFQLRRQVGVDLVVPGATAATAALAEGVSHDLLEADTLLDGVPLEVGGEFAQWLALQRDRRRGRLRRSLAELAEMAESAKDWDDALTHARELLALEPLSEEAHRRVIRLHYLRGDRAAALLAFDHCEQVLKDEVGAQPSAETMALLATVSASAGDAALPAPAAVPASVLRPPRLVGRDRHLRALAAAWEAGEVVAVAGEGGLGKSRLVGDFARSLGAGVVAIVARPGDALLPYAMLSRMLRQLLPREGMNIEPGVRAELTTILPELGHPEVPAAGKSATRFVNAVEAAIDGALATGLHGLVLDDLHLADSASAELLLSIGARGAGAGRLRVAVAFRPAELPARIGSTLDALANEQRLRTVLLEPLAPAQVGELLDSLGIDGVEAAAQAASLHRRTGGNPLFVLEVLKARIGGGVASDAGVPSSVDRLIMLRIARLSPAAVRLARCAAVAGQDFSAALAATVLQTPALDLADAWNELDAAQILRDGVFAHDLIYEAALSSVPGPIARELHAQIATFLGARGGDPARVAQHWQDAAQPRQAVPWLRTVAEQATARFRYAEAAQTYAALGRILEDAGDTAAAFDAWFAGVNAAASLGDREVFGRLVERTAALAVSDAQIARAAVGKASFEIGRGDFDTALEAAERGIPAARREGLAEAESDLLYMRGLVRWERRQIPEALADIRPAVELRRNLPPQTLRPDHAAELITMLTTLSVVLGGAGQFTEAAAVVAEAYALAVDAAMPQEMLLACAQQCWIWSERGQIATALEWAERGVAASLSGDCSPPDRVYLGLGRANVLVVDGRWGEALAQFDGMTELVATGLCERSRPDLAVRSGLLYRLLGRRDLALKQGEAQLEAGTGSAAQRLALQLLLLECAQPVDVADLLDRVAAVQDVGMRARLLARLAAHAPAQVVLPLLRITADTVRDGGLAGQALTLQARIAARLADIGRAGEAGEVARAAWERAEAGCSPAQPFAEFAADLCHALAGFDAALFATVCARGEAWHADAAASLPPPWRQSCSDRGSLRLLLQAARARAGRA